MKELTGIIGQYACLATMWVGFTYEVYIGAPIGWAIFTGGAIGAMIFTKIRGK